MVFRGTEMSSYYAAFAEKVGELGQRAIEETHTAQGLLEEARWFAGTAWTEGLAAIQDQSWVVGGNLLKCAGDCYSAVRALAEKVCYLLSARDCVSRTISVQRAVRAYRNIQHKWRDR